MGNSNIKVFSTSVRTAICHRSSLLIEFPQEPVKQLANTTHITDTMYKGKGTSQNEPYSSEMNKNTLYSLILSIITCNIFIFAIFPSKTIPLNIIYRFNNVIGFVNNGTLKHCNNGHQDHHVKILLNTQTFLS